MYCRNYCIQVWKYSLSFRSQFYNYTIKPNSIPSDHRQFLKSRISYQKFQAMQNLSQTYKNDGVYPTVYVISRIKQLSLTIKSLSNDIYPELNVEEIDVPADSDILSHSNLEKLLASDVIVADPKIIAMNYRNMPNLKWAHCTWAGVEPLFENMEEKPQFIVTRHGEEEFSEQMAEYVMGQILMLQKDFKGIWAAQVEKSWCKMQKCAHNCSRNVRLKELTISVLGVGNMGQAIAKFFKPHGTKVIGLSRTVRKPNEYGLFDKIVSSLTDALADSDYIINTLPSTPATIGLLNGDVLKACIKAPVFINVGRSSIISEDTLLKALKNNWLSHAILDVFQEEPLPINNKLWNLGNQITITPHCAAISLPKDIAKSFLSCLLCYQQGSPMKNIVDWEKKY